ncbi:sushi, von Willebrand factor type A, EGF and pentraxin domain-containing protein 1-like isoform X1 [Oscarella lobularis]|uniref:sushi, von Willebrand factor type A, EGF and pentraxin domain-containing protein 1-like isoform X1 n=1 Tax=Oscarella lobularis TaxID=121494 RepID=UPI0033132FEF
MAALYACPYGTVHGYQIMQCGDDGKWIENLKPCEAVDCGKPNDPLYGYHWQLSDDYTFKAEIEYDCYYGYELQGGRKASCQSTGKWDLQSLPVCQVMSCPELAPPQFGTVQLEGRNVNDTAKFMCDSGYDLVGHHAVTCKVINKIASWSHLSPTCQPKKCIRPRVPVNGRIIGEDFHYPNIIEFVCNQGYILTPAKSVWRCMENGKWKDDEKEETDLIFPTCEPVDCGKPDDPLYGYHRKLSSYKFKAEVEYACYYGYELQGERKALCQSTGNWDSPSPPKCEVMRCPGLAPPQFGAVQLEGRNVNDTAKFMCNSGYNLVGDETLTCKVINKGASWSHVPPTCQPKQCGAPPVPVNGEIVGEDFHYPNTIKFTCNKGYILTPAKSVWRCSENGKWKDNERRETKFPTCEPVNCGEPSMIPNGKYIGKEFTFGKRITYECNSGFKRSAWVQSTCLHTGHWSLPPPQCSQINCSHLSAPDNGKMEISAGQIIPGPDGFVFSFGSVVTFWCCPGHDLTINNKKANVETVQLKCEQEGEQERARGVWKGKLTSQPPTCPAKNCGPLPDIPNGKVAFIPNKSYPGKAHYSCNPGFQIAEGEDAAVRSCGTNGIWDGFEPHCQHKCATKICPSYQLCKLINNEATCVCLQRDKCSSDYNPVCGDDGKNYNNECLMKVAGCLAGNPDISVAKRGDCKYGGVCLTERPSPPEENPRCGFFTRYYYDYTRGECKLFQFGGCFVGRNSFVSRKKCEDTCKPDPCGLEKDPGLCSGREERWYYNSVTKRCERFDYTGCFGNENNFVNEAKCYERCEDYSKPTVITTLPPTTAPPSIEECCNHTLKGNKNICEESKYVVAAKIVRVVKFKEGFAKYEIKVTDVVKGKRKGELWDMTSLEISRVGKCSTILCPQFGVGDKFLVGGKKQRNKVIHLDRRDNYLKPFAKDKRDQLQRVCN